MNKPQLVEQVASQAGVDKRQAESVLNAFFETVQSTVRGGEKISWPGFGSFAVTQRAARTGRNPQTGAAVNIPASNAMKFSASSTLKDFLNQKGGGKKAAPAKKAAKKASSTTKKR